MRCSNALSNLKHGISQEECAYTRPSNEYKTAVCVCIWTMLRSLIQPANVKMRNVAAAHKC